MRCGVLLFQGRGVCGVVKPPRLSSQILSACDVRQRRSTRSMVLILKLTSCVVLTQKAMRFRAAVLSDSAVGNRDTVI